MSVGFSTALRLALRLRGWRTYFLFAALLSRITYRYAFPAPSIRHIHSMLTGLYCANCVNSHLLRISFTFVVLH